MLSGRAVLTFEDFETFLYGAAAAVDTAVLLVVLPRRNWGKILIPLMVLVGGTWLYHTGSFVHMLLWKANAEWAPPLQWSAMMLMATGLSVLPSATLHILWRLARAGFSQDATHHRRVILVYIPVLLLWPVGQMLWTDPGAPFLDLLQPIIIPYVAAVMGTNTLVAVGCFWIRNRFEDAAERAFTLLLATALLIVAGAYGLIFFVVLPRFPDWYHQLTALAALAPVVLSLVLAYAILRFRIMRLVLKRSVVYGAALAAAVLLHHLVLEDMWNSLGDTYNLDFVLLEGIVFLMIVLAYRPLRERASEALHYLMGERAAETRDEARRIALEMSAMVGEDPQRVLTWFAEEVKAALRVDYVALWQVQSEAIISRVASTSLLEDDRALGVFNDVGRAREPWCTIADAPTREVARALQKAEASLAVTASHPHVGVLLLLGPRPRNRELTHEQIAAMLMLVEHLGITLDNSVLQRQRLEAERRALLNDKLSTLGLVASSIAHEVKNPLSSIKTIATVMKEDLGQGSSHDEDLRLILSEVDRLSSRVGDILSFARPSANGATVSASEAISGTVRVMGHLAKKRGVAFVTDVPEDLPHVQGEEAGFREVIFNLLANAIEAAAESEAGRPAEVKVEAAREGESVELRVTDNGDGIPLDLQETIFEPFATGRVNGTGLGLYVVSRRVAEMGGTIECSSSDTGTCFTVSFRAETP